MEGPSGMAGNPGQHLGMLMGSVVVEDGMDHLCGRDVGFDAVEETDEILMGMALHAAADHIAFQHVERGEQRRGPVLSFAAVGSEVTLTRLLDADLPLAWGDQPAFLQALARAT